MSVVLLQQAWDTRVRSARERIVLMALADEGGNDGRSVDMTVTSHTAAKAGLSGELLASVLDRLVKRGVLSYELGIYRFADPS